MRHPRFNLVFDVKRSVHEKSGWTSTLGWCCHTKMMWWGSETGCSILDLSHWPAKVFPLPFLIRWDPSLLEWKMLYSQHPAASFIVTGTDVHRWRHSRQIVMEESIAALWFLKEIFRSPYRKLDYLTFKHNNKTYLISRNTRMHAYFPIRRTSLLHHLLTRITKLIIWKILLVCRIYGLNLKQSSLCLLRGNYLSPCHVSRRTSVYISRY